MGPTTVGTHIEKSTTVYCEDQLQRTVSAMTFYLNGNHTLASIMVESSQPKFERTCVLVHIRSRTKNHARTKNAMVILSCCSPDRATLSSLWRAISATRPDCRLKGIV
jgi:hypothetical protein